ncbi:MAG: SdiA-regulated domain-containing protein [Gammaproteobacteria bacterium]|nr:SdiA-regulated domain-containing protein [Gammaproteobacteria bacterium]MDH3767812.1 SdiA-regulated domain-containing protein [Gammaproteobacteria bacterium]
MAGTRFAALLLIAVLIQAPSTGAVGADSVLANYSFSETTLTQWKLPSKLREISGLVFHDGRLFTHNDQLGIVYEIDYREARLVKAFALGKKTVRADFEGIAAVGDTFYMVTSNGRLFIAREGGNGERVPYKSYKTKLGRRCEIEGLAHDVPGKRLLLVCKQPRSNELKGRIAIFVWSLEQERILESETIMVKHSAIHDLLSTKHFNPSGIEVDSHTGHLLLIAARQHAIAEIDLNGQVITAFQLPLASRHRQAEGIALTADRDLIVADEGGRGKARLAIYEPGS